MSTQASGASRSGGDGIHNEDAFVVREGLGLYVVSDGESGRPAGEVASAIVARALESHIREQKVDLQNATRVDGDFLVEQGMAKAFRALREAERDDPTREGMSASVTMLLTDGSRGVIGHSGDSRAYLVRKRKTTQLTVDQDLTDEVAVAEPGAGYVVFGVEFEPGDTIILCTDGAEAIIEDSDLSRVAGSLSPVVLVSRIVSDANRRDPSRDATAVAVRVRGDRGPGWVELSGAPRRTRFGHTLVHSPGDLPEPEPAAEVAESTN